MSILCSTKTISNICIILPEIHFDIYVFNALSIIIDIFYLIGESISPYLLRCKGFAVDDDSCILCALHLRQPRLVNNPG
jgi:hypothetical protein